MSFVLCINNKRYKRRLKLHVVYRAVQRGAIWWVMDETGILHKYGAKVVVPIELPAEVAATFDALRP